MPGATVLVVFNLSAEPTQLSLAPGLADAHPVEGHGLVQGRIDGNRLVLPAYGVWYAEVA